MSINKGSRVAVNLAAFIGSESPSKHRVACRAVELAGDSVLVRTEEPYRAVSLWVRLDWVEPLPPEEHQRPRRASRAAVS